jgi:hypothetical protein
MSAVFPEVCVPKVEVTLLVWHRDVIYLDLALESALRGLLEARMGELRAWTKADESLHQLIQITATATESACISFGSNSELFLSFKDMQVCSFLRSLCSSHPLLPTRAGECANEARMLHMQS